MALYPCKEEKQLVRLPLPGQVPSVFASDPLPSPEIFVSLCSLRRHERPERDLWRAVEPERDSDRSYAAVDVKLRVPYLEVALGIILTEKRQGQRSEAGDTDLSSVGVSGEDEVDERATRMGRDGVSVVGFMCHQDHRGIRGGGDSVFEVWAAPGNIVQSAQEDMLPVSFDADMFIDQHGKTVVFHMASDDA